MIKAALILLVAMVSLVAASDSVISERYRRERAATRAYLAKAEHQARREWREAQCEANREMRQARLEARRAYRDALLQSRQAFRDARNDVRTF